MEKGLTSKCCGNDTYTHEGGRCNIRLLVYEKGLYNDQNKLVGGELIIYISMLNCEGHLWLPP